MLLLPEKAIGNKYNSKLILLTTSYERKDSIKFYCESCKSYFDKTASEEDMYHYNREIMLKCPNCNYSINYADLKKVDKQYMQSREAYLDNHLLRIKFKYVMYKFYNNTLIYENYLSMFVSNLETGYTYSLPILKNKKKFKRSGKFCNVSYNFNTADLDYAGNININCKNSYTLYKTAVNLVREYKMKQLGFYIPTIDEQAKYAKEMDYSTNIYTKIKVCSGEKISLSTMRFANRHYKEVDQVVDYRSELIASLNRFPAVNIFNSKKIFTVDPYILSCKKDTDKLRRFRRAFPMLASNPFKTAVESYGCKYTKGLKAFTHYDMEYLYTYVTLSKLGLKQSNILKLMNFIKDHSRSNKYFAATYLLNISENYKYFMKFKNYNENSFIKKMINSIAEIKNRHSFYMIDTLSMGGKIKKNIKDYDIDLKNNIKYLHDTLSIDFTKLNRANKVFKYKKAHLLVNTTIDNLKFELAKDSHELIEVGSNMGICVGSYGDSAYEKNCYIIIARDVESNEAIVCIELDKEFKSIKQCKLKRNSTPNIGTDIYNIMMKWKNHSKLNLNTYDLVIEKTAKTKTPPNENVMNVDRFVNVPLLRVPEINDDYLEETVQLANF